MTRRMTIGRFMVLTLLSVLVAACGSKDDTAAPGNSDAKPTPQAPRPIASTPEEFGLLVFKTLQENDHDTYSTLCATWEEMDAYMSKLVKAIEAQTPADKLQVFREQVRLQRKELQTRWQDKPASWKQDFDEMVREIDWPSVRSTNVRLKMNSSRDNGVVNYDVFVELDNGRELYIDDVAETPAGWRITESKPLSLRPISTTK